jgi:hypothetical protein
MQNAEIRTRPAKCKRVTTISFGVVNEIVSVGTDAVWVRSERTGDDRRITFNGIRNWDRGRHDSRVRLALARKLGLAG